MTTAAVLVCLLIFLLLARWLSAAFELATGYSAKQICSGFYVAGLPAEFIAEKDVQMSVSALGPLVSQLAVDLTEPQVVRASLLGVEARAVYTGERGCILNPGPEVRPAAGAGLARPAIAALPVAPLAELVPLFDEAFAEPADGQRQTLALLVLHRGKPLAERYAPGVDALTPLQGWSMNKSLMATWVGLQVARGELALEASVRESIGGMDPELAGSVSPELNLSHLLHMESGLEFEETYFPGDDATRMLYRSPAMWRVAPGNGQRHSPGTVFNYSSGDTNLASMIWTRSLGDQPYTEWLREHFSGPLGLLLATSEPDAAGIQVGSSYTYMPARSWAVIGQLWLDAWHGRSGLLSRDWMRASVTPRPASAEGNYGRGFWLNTQGNQFRDLPTTLFYASGHNSQYLMVLPEQELVVVRLGLSSSREADGFEPFMAGLLESVSEPVPVAVEPGTTRESPIDLAPLRALLDKHRPAMEHARGRSLEVGHDEEHADHRHEGGDPEDQESPTE